MVTRRVSEDEGRLFPHIRAIRGFHVGLPKNTKLSAKVAWGPGPWSGAELDLANLPIQGKPKSRNSIRIPSRRSLADLLNYRSLSAVNHPCDRFRKRLFFDDRNNILHFSQPNKQTAFFVDTALRPIGINSSKLDRNDSILELRKVLSDLFHSPFDRASREFLSFIINGNLHKILPEF